MVLRIADLHTGADNVDIRLLRAREIDEVCAGSCVLPYRNFRDIHLRSIPSLEDSESLLEGRKIDVTGDVDMCILGSEGSIVCLDVINCDGVDAFIGRIVSVDAVSEP